MNRVTIKKIEALASQNISPAQRRMTRSTARARGAKLAALKSPEHTHLMEPGTPEVPVRPNFEEGKEDGEFEDQADHAIAEDDEHEDVEEDEEEVGEGAATNEGAVSEEDEEEQQEPQLPGIRSRPEGSPIRYPSSYSSSAPSSSSSSSSVFTTFGSTSEGSYLSSTAAVAQSSSTSSSSTTSTIPSSTTTSTTTTTTAAPPSAAMTAAGPTTATTQVKAHHKKKLFDYPSPRMGLIVLLSIALGGIIIAVLGSLAFSDSFQPVQQFAFQDAPDFASSIVRATYQPCLIAARKSWASTRALFARIPREVADLCGSIASFFSFSSYAGEDGRIAIPGVEPARLAALKSEWLRDVKEMMEVHGKTYQPSAEWEAALINKLESAWRSDIHAASAQVTQNTQAHARESAAQLSREIADTRERIERALIELHRLAPQSEQHAAHINSLRQSLASLGADMEKLASRENHVESQVQTLTHRVAENEARAKEADQTVQDAQRQLQAFNARLTSAATMDANTVREIVNENVEQALEKFAADRTGKMDYLSYATGGRVLDISGELTEGSESPATAWLPSWLRERIAGPMDRPRDLIISPEPLTVGRCCPLPGQQGWVLFELHYRVLPSHVVIEHPSRALVPEADTAPKELAIYGVDDESVDVAHSSESLTSATTAGVTLLRRFTYDIHAGRSLQTFALENPLGKSYRYLRLEVLGNHGNSEYTCLYRVRVHGERPAAAAASASA